LRIKSLQITGFKSFVDRTRFDFKPGITGIVGPNGCGKSNVVDAMRWAMGEQSPRRLRGKGMEDVIFAGSDSRAPIGMAEVVLSFDNAEGTAPPAFAAYSEIQIARRLYRSGESEYLINKVPCRLRDVQDFFRDTGIGTRGYTIVEQGQIAGIVSAKPEDRRYLIEEAAGIGKYKARRQEAERKIEATEGNLVRVNDVLGEIRRQIGTIERQAKKAARYKRLRESQRLLELSLAADERAELAGQREAATRRHVQVRDEATALDARVAERELALEQGRLELAERERVLSADTEVLVGLRGAIKELESRIGYETRERAALAEMNAARQEELARLAEQLSAARAEAERARAERVALEGALDAEAGAIADAEGAVRAAEESVRELERERDLASGHLVQALTRVARAEDRLAALADRHAAIDRRLRSADAEIEVTGSEETRAAAEEDAIAEGLRNLLAERERLMEAARGASARAEGSAREARAASERLRDARELRETRRARLASLREVIERREDLGAAARHVLEQDESARAAIGLRALARDVLQVDRELEAAVEAVLADRAEALVVGDLSGALAGVEMLHGAAAGRAVFVAALPDDAGASGFVPLGEPLALRVRAREGFESVVRRLLGGVNLVADLREVLAVYGGGRIPATFVTPRGDLLTPDGVVRGGEGGAGSGLLTRVREVRELEEEMAVLEADVAMRESARAGAEAAAAQAADELENLRSRHHTAALAVANHEKDLERAKERVKTLGVAQESRVAERGGLLAEVERLAAEREQLERGLEEGRRERLERQNALEALGLRVGSASRDLAREQATLSGRRVEHATRVEKRDALRDAERRAEGSLRETSVWIERREAEIAHAEARRETLAATVADAESELAQRLRDEEEARTSSEAKREAYEREAEAVRALEAEARTLRTDAAARREEAGRCELGLRELELRLQHLEDGVRERWNLDLASWAPPRLEDVVDEAPPAVAHGEEEGGPVAELAEAEAEAAAPGDEEPALTPRAAAELVRLPRAERETRLADVRRRVEALGEVNLGAIEEHEELAERFRFLTEQKTDLETTLASLRAAIQRINRTSRRRFRETFEAVAARFSENFPRLFRGGKATLSLTEEEDVLEAGIEIMASPPGKRVVNVNALSGGEKTLTAVALLVSVFQVRPSPFFLLDEVDAALDDANVGRFNEIVRELSKESQFLVVTHNKRTIEIADILYGVTMEEKGVSKLVSVELHA
jgi:chromosome segregation protein